MPEKSLPFFRENQPSQQDPLNPQNKGTSSFPGANLISETEILPANFFYIDKAFRFFRKASLFITLVFGLMLITNIVLNLKLESEKKRINQLANEVGRYTLVQKQAIDVDKKTKFYQNTLTARHILGDKTQVIFSNLDPTTALTSISIVPEKFSMTIEVKSPLDFATLVAKYLESDKIGSVTLRSADLIAGKNVFKVSMEGTYK